MDGVQLAVICRNSTCQGVGRDSGIPRCELQHDAACQQSADHGRSYVEVWTQTLIRTPITATASGAIYLPPRPQVSTEHSSWWLMPHSVASEGTIFPKYRNACFDKSLLFRVFLPLILTYPIPF